MVCACPLRRRWFFLKKTYTCTKKTNVNTMARRPVYGFIYPLAAPSPHAPHAKAQALQRVQDR